MLGWIVVALITLSAGLALWVAKVNADRTLLRSQLRKEQADREDAAARHGRWKEKAEMFSASIEQLRHGVMLLSTDGKILALNPAASYLLNLDGSIAWKNRPLIEVVRLPELNQAVSVVRQEFERNKPVDELQKLSVKVPYFGNTQSVKVRVGRIQTSKQQRILVSLQDETDAILLDEMRREFVANTSHELKTPLAAIKGYAETVELAINDDPTAAKHFMSQINVQCQRLERLIADMMQLARAQSADFMHTISSVSVLEVINQSVTSNLPVAEAKSVTLVNEIGGDHQPDSDVNDWAFIRADPDAVLTIVNNLISNAIRYTNSGGQVFAGVRDADKHCAIYVRDTGVGIAPTDQKRVFERFFRVNKNRQFADTDGGTSLGTAQGTGIGLSIVKQLSKALGGEVSLSSKPGIGSEFVVRLPKALPPAASSVSPATSTPDSDTASDASSAI